MAAVMIGAGPHKGSHTAVAIGAAEEPLGQVRVRASAAQAERLLGVGCVLAAADLGGRGRRGPGAPASPAASRCGEQVLEVQPKLGARVRLLASGDTNKNDPNDARSVAIAALRSGACLLVRPDDHAAVLKVWAKRHRDLGRTRTQVVCRLHAVLAGWFPGGVSKRITAAHAARVLEQVTVSGAVAQARQDLAAGFLDDLRRIDTQMRETRKRLTAAVRASGTTLTEIFGVGPVIAAVVIGRQVTVAGLPAGTASLPTTALRRSRCLPAAARFTGYPGAATGASTTPCTWPQSPRSASVTATAAPITTRRWPTARPPKKRCGPSNARSATRSSST